MKICTHLVHVIMACLTQFDPSGSQEGHECEHVLYLKNGWLWGKGTENLDPVDIIGKYIGQTEFQLVQTF